MRQQGQMREMKCSLRYWSGLAAVVVAAAACSQQPQPPVTTPAPTSDVASGVVAVPGDLLRPDQLAAESAKAADGDPLAAERVASYYAFADPKHKDTEFWIRVAIENGSILWIDSYARRLVADGGADRCRRALYWMRRARELQPDRASDFSALIEEFRSRPGCSELKEPATL